MRKRDTQRRETCAGGRKSENERDTPTGRWASSWSSWGSSNPERAASQASRGPGSDGPSVLRLMEVLSPGFGSPELPRTQLAYRLSLAPEGKGQENRSLVQSQVLAGQEETFSLTRKMGTAVPQSQRSKEKPRGEPVPGPKPSNRPLRMQLPDLCLGGERRKKKKKTGPT